MRGEGESGEGNGERRREGEKEKGGEEEKCTDEKELSGGVAD